MPELPELEALRLRMGPRLEGKLITAASVAPKKAHLLRYPVEEFARELPARRITALTRRGKHLAFATELGVNVQQWFLLNNGRLLRARINFLERFYDRAEVTGRSVYGTDAAFRGHARPGARTTLIDVLPAGKKKSFSSPSSSVM